MLLVGLNSIVFRLGLMSQRFRRAGHRRTISQATSKTSDAKHGQWKVIEELKGVRFTIASDVKNPLCGENGAAYVFGSQKFADEGATPDKIQQLDERARKFADISARHFGYDRSKAEGAGAAGGLGYAFMQYLNADCKPGIQLLLETIHYSEIVKNADLVITGEGSADRQTLMGKLPLGILQQSGNVPVCLIGGRISDREELLRAGFARVECINPEGISHEEAMRKEVAAQNISHTVCHLIATSSAHGNLVHTGTDPTVHSTSSAQ